MDPWAALGLEPDASAAEVTAAYRRLAKRFHPDRAGDRGAQRMAEINAAYDQLRDGVREPQTVAAGAGVIRGAWLPEETREALGPELLRVLVTGERIDMVVTASTWASPHTLLAVSDRRLLWLLDDAVTTACASSTTGRSTRSTTGSPGRARGRPTCASTCATGAG